MMTEKSVFIVSLTEDRVRFGAMGAGRHPDVRESENGVSVSVRGDSTEEEDELASWLCHELMEETRRG